MSVSDLPTLNAALNATSAVLLATGWTFIRRKNVHAHRTCMVGAFLVSTVFFASYLFYHWHHGSTPFEGTGWIRPVYFTILVTHVILAMFVPPLAILALLRAAGGRFAAHRRVARFAFPVWMYVSVTGVAVYWLLYRVYPQG